MRNHRTRGARFPFAIERLVTIRGRQRWGEQAGRNTKAEAEGYVNAQPPGEFRIRERAVRCKGPLR